MYFQSARTASPIKSGVYILPLTIIEALTGIAAGIYIHRTGRYIELIFTGMALLTLGTGLYLSLIHI